MIEEDSWYFGSRNSMAEEVGWCFGSHNSMVEEWRVGILVAIIQWQRRWMRNFPGSATN
jgi:hypothetical protein